MTQNEYKNTKQSAFRRRGWGRLFAGMLDGSLLIKNTPSSAIRFILYLSGLSLFLIFNAYYAEKKAREANRLQREMTEWRIRYIETKSEYMFMTKQSELARQLKGRGFIQSTGPPVTIYHESQ